MSRYDHDAMNRPLRYVAIGDSLSEGVGDDPWPDGTPRGWTDRLAELLAADRGEVDYANFAVRGKRSREIRDEQVEAALALQPDLMTFTAGMNDLLRPTFDPDELRRVLVDVVTPFVRAGAQVMVVPIPDITAVSPAGRLMQRRRGALNAIYRHLAQEHGMLPPPDTTGSVFEDRRAWADDRLHLSPLGHERLAVGAADLFGVRSEADWMAVPEGLVPRRTIRTEVTWWRTYVGPWVGRRVTGRSSGDGISAKHPTFVHLTPTDHRDRVEPS